MGGRWERRGREVGLLEKKVGEIQTKGEIWCYKVGDERLGMGDGRLGMGDGKL